MDSHRSPTGLPPPALVIVPTFNERANIEGLVRAIRSNGCEVLVVDDGSPDGTGELAGDLAQSDPGVHVLQRGRKLGLGTAYIAGLRRGVEWGFDLLVTMDADGSHRPMDLQSVLAGARKGSAVAIGSRYVPGGTIVGWSFRRKLLSRAANRYAQSLLGLTVHDCTSGYRCYPRSVIQSIGLETVVSDGYAFLIEVLHRCQGVGVPIVEVPIRFEDRVAGKSKVSAQEIVKASLLVPRLRRSGAAPPSPAAAAAYTEIDLLGTQVSARSPAVLSTDDHP
jgi:dolichol-phosphate mannosyltransferase